MVQIKKLLCGFLGLIPLIITGCASHVPIPIRVSLPEQVSIGAVRANPERYIEAPVRWGGEIVSLENRAEETWVQLLAFPLSRDGRPRTETESRGRFLARIRGFLDPAIFTEGRELTVTGRVEAQVMRRIGEYPYNFPLIRVENYYLWPPLIEHHDPWYYDPWYDPWYSPGFYSPWGPRPYWRPSIHLQYHYFGGRPWHR